MTARTATDAAADRFELGASRQQAARDRTAIQHEIVRLFDDLAPSATPGRRAPISAEVTAYRWPNRCILQGPTHAVSLTWFPGTRDDDSLGELLVMTWRGRVSLPGSASRGLEEAVAVSQQVLHPTGSVAGWGWSAADDTALRTTDAVAAAARRAADGTA